MLFEPRRVGFLCNETTISPHLRQVRTLVPSDKESTFGRMGRLHFGHTSITFDTWIEASFSRIPPGVVWVGRECFFTKLILDISTRSSSRNTLMTSPCLPRLR